MYINGERAMAWIATVEDVATIPGADKICAYFVSGWWVVDGINKYQVGDSVIYISVDSWVPNTIAPFLSKGKKPRTYNNVLGEKLKTIKLKGQLSQGLLLHPSIIQTANPFSEGEVAELKVGNDVTQLLGIQKWEEFIPACLSGQAEGSFPSCIPKTNQERVQNYRREVFDTNKDTKYEVTLKMHGTSATYFRLNEKYGICSRNWMLKNNTENENNLYVKFFNDNKLKEFLDLFDEDVAIQGELVGPGIQDNFENTSDVMLFIFDVYLIKQQRYALPIERHSMLDKILADETKFIKIQKIQVMEYNKRLNELGLNTLDDVLQYAEGAGMNIPMREGLVFKAMNKDFSFKAVSNGFLLRYEQ